MNRRSLSWALYFLAAALLSLSSIRSARAASNDEDVELLVSSVMEGEYAKSEYAEALDKLELARQACEGKTSCSPKTRARLYIALGTVLAGGFEKTREAKDAFVIALREDPTVALFGDYQSPDAQRAFNEARTVAKGSSGNEEQEEEGGRKLKRYPGGGRAPAGWLEAEAYFHFREAVLSEKEREWLDCAYYAQASLAVETRPTTRFLAATCEERAGLWIEALSDYQAVSEVGRKTGGTDIGRQAKERIKSLRERIPKIIIRKPPKAENLVVKMNDDEIPPKKLGGEIWVNPGQRTITATGKVDGKDLEFEQSIDLAEFETATIEIKLAPKGASGDAAVIRCMAQSFTRAEFAKCIGASLGGGAALNYSAGFEFSAYHDSDNANAITPTITFGVDSPTSGWGVGGSFLVDVVSTASSDIVASASAPVREFRYAPAVGGHKKFGAFDVGLHTAASIEPDYLATGGGASVSMELANKTVTPSLGYDFGYDIQGRYGTPYSTFGEPLMRHAVDAGVGIVLDKATFLAVSATAVFEFGDSSKPYRYIPTFDADDVATIQPGQKIQQVHALRLAPRVIEQVPVDRQRWAIAGRIAHRFASSTIRFEERLYTDSWGLKASTTDSIYFIDVSPVFRVWPHVRVNAQTGVDFWKLAYSATYNAAQSRLTVPFYRTGDRELGPLITVTGGLGTKFALGEDKNWGLTLAGEFVYTRFLETLYIQQRFGYFGKTVLEVDWE